MGLVHGVICSDLSVLGPIAAPLQAVFDRVRQLINAAGEAGVQVLCLQEAWHMPFAFCTREKAWCEFAEPVHSGPSTRLCQELARKYGMVGAGAALQDDAAPVHCCVAPGAAQPCPVAHLLLPAATAGDHQPHSGA
jgi:beta-ureidopropionase